MNDELLFDQIILVPLVRTYRDLKEGYAVAKSPLEKNGVVKLFELCYELSWKVLKDVLEYKGLQVTSPRDTFREAAMQGIIANPQAWFQFIKTRNETVHKYDEELIEDIYKVLPSFLREVDCLLEVLSVLNE